MSKEIANRWVKTRKRWEIWDQREVEKRWRKDRKQHGRKSYL